MRLLRTSPASAPHLTREMQDAFAVRSHQRAVAAIDSGKFAEEIVAVAIPQSKGSAKGSDDGRASAPRYNAGGIGDGCGPHSAPTAER